MLRRSLLALMVVAACGPPEARPLPPSPPPAPAPPPPAPGGCETAPDGMVCIPAGPAVIGSDDHEAQERPRHQVEVSTFYIDQTEVTNGAYEACVAAKACTPRIPPEPTFNRPEQPAAPLTWEMAHDFCRWAGKRMPTEAEWEKVARGGEEGRLYPWGDEEPTCDRAQTVGCPPKTTLPVGSKPAGAYGVYDMAGNGYEWVQDWATNCYEGKCLEPCGEACMGTDPAGPCAGASTCPSHKQKVLKGGSWYWPADQARGSWRRPSKLKTGVHRLGVRCASTTAQLTGWPPQSFVEPRAALEAPKPPTEAERAIAHSIPEDTDVLSIPLCSEINVATHRCRDPHSYVLSNEPDQWKWRRFIEDIGGAYVGIGSDQSYNFIAAAKSRWAFLFDYDPAVVRVHYAIRAAVLDSPTREAFVAHFAQRRLPELERLVEASLPEVVGGEVSEDEMKQIRIMLGQASSWLYQAYKDGMKPRDGERGKLGWLRDEASYQYVRTLYQQGRIVLRKGNLLTDVALPHIGEAARKLGVPVRILYTSNADDQWDLTAQYRENLRSLPYDEHSIVLRTLLPRHRLVRKGAPWDYTVHGALDMVRRVARPELRWWWWLQPEGHRRDGNVVAIGVPGPAPAFPQPAPAARDAKLSRAN